MDCRTKLRAGNKLAAAAGLGLLLAAVLPIKPMRSSPVLPVAVEGAHRQVPDEYKGVFDTVPETTAGIRPIANSAVSSSLSIVNGNWVERLTDDGRREEISDAARAAKGSQENLPSAAARTAPD